MKVDKVLTWFDQTYFYPHIRLEKESNMLLSTNDKESFRFSTKNIIKGITRYK